MLNLSKLNRAQAEAVSHGLGPALVLAGPGSGKTYTIVHRICYLIEYSAVPPDSILVISFTKAAARSLQQRFHITMQENFSPVHFGTFHSFFFQILRRFSHYNTESILSKEEKLSLAGELLLSDGKLMKKSDISPEDFLKAFGNYQNNPDAFLVEQLPCGVDMLEFQNLSSAYRERCQKERRLDYDDMAILCLELLQNNPHALDACRRKYQHIFIDEYQDTNPLQYEVIKLLAKPHNNLFAVGDDDQAIYGFRGSTPGIMQDFMRQYPQAKGYLLNVNYRSTPEIVHVASKMIALNKNRYPKEITSGRAHGNPVRYQSFVNREEEYEYAALRLQENRNVWTYGQMAVISRTNRDLESISEILEEQGIPYRLSERHRNRFENFVVRDILQCVSFCCGFKKREPEIWRKLKGNRHKRETLAKLTPYAALHYFRSHVGYDRYLSDLLWQKPEQMKACQEWLKRLEGSSRKYFRLEDWLAALEKHTDDWKKEDKENAEEGVRLLTIHGAKGLEFSYVCLVDINEGVIPTKNIRSTNVLEEERRMLYVGMTRAKEAMDILYLTGTKDSPQLPSRFLNPLLGRH